MASIKFDNVEILNTTYMPQFVKHETAPERSLISVPLARDDGEVLIATRYGRKVIQLRGTLRASSEALLDTAIGAFKELFSRPEKNLDVSWEGGTLRYVATCSKHEFDRDHYHLSFAPWTAEFVVSSGVGKSTSDTLALNEEALTTDDTDTPGTFIADASFTLSGSKAPAPVITLEIVSADADMKGIEYKNTGTGERIVITRDVDWSAATGKKIIIDCENRRVTDDLSTTEQVEGPFFGVFPRFILGTNNVRITTGGIVNQESDEPSVPYPSAANFVSLVTDVQYAVSFTVPYGDDTFGAIQVGLTKSGTPAGACVVTLHADDGGKPGASTLAAWDIVAGDVPLYPSYDYITKWPNGGTAITLQPQTRYWLKYLGQSPDASNHFKLNISSAIRYPRGSTLLSTNAGSTWASNSPNIPAFKVLIGGQSAATGLKHTVSYTKTYL